MSEWKKRAAEGLRSAREGDHQGACQQLAIALAEAQDGAERSLITNCLAVVAYQMGDYQAAQEQFDRAVAVWDSEAGSTAHTTAVELAEVLEACGFEEQAELVRQRLQGESPPLLNPWRDLGDSESVLGGVGQDVDAATDEPWDVKVNYGLHLLHHQYPEDAARRFSSALGQGGLQDCLATACLAMAKFVIGDYVGARQLFEDAAALWNSGGYQRQDPLLLQLLAMLEQLEMTREAQALRARIERTDGPPLINPFEDMAQPDSLATRGTVGVVELGAGGSWAELLEQGIALMAGRQLDAATRKFAHSLGQAKVPGERCYSNNLMAMASFVVGDYQQAEEAYSTAKSLWDGDPEVRDPELGQRVVELLRANQYGTEAEVLASKISSGRPALVDPWDDVVPDGEGEGDDPPAVAVTVPDETAEPGDGKKPWWRLW